MRKVTTTLKVTVTATELKNFCMICTCRRTVKREKVTMRVKVKILKRICCDLAEKCLPFEMLKEINIWRCNHRPPIYRFRMSVYSYLDVSPFHLQFDRTQPSLNSFHHANNLPLYYSTDPAEIKFCLDHGLDPNFIHKHKKIIFRLILDGFHWNGIYDECLDETVAMLLYYGGNPAIESRTDNCSELFGPYSAFEFVSLQMYDQVSNFVFQELLMHTMNDDSKCGKLRLQTFLHLVYKQKFLEKSRDRNHNL
ncbi:uncharacterized protein LOC135138468 [Zophobas morio]|uniref:uncharacterized protein LOC135138468 n=1 Tax=Zophobas morio TaxID=2755281 RepID=UPI003082944A